MRVARDTAIILILITLLTGAAAAEKSAVRSDSIDFGSETLKHLEVLLGPFQAALGLFDRVMVGTYILPWFATSISAGSIVPNIFVKGELLRLKPVSIGVLTGAFYLHLNDLDGDALNMRAWLWPTRFFVESHWLDRWPTTLELTAVLAGLSADRLVDQATEVEGVGLASNLHIGVIQRFQLSDAFTFWARFRYLIDRAPVSATAKFEIDDNIRFNVRAQTDTTASGSGIAGMAGLFWTWRSLTVRAGVGYGTWYIPWANVPIGSDMIGGEFDAYVRF